MRTDQVFILGDEAEFMMSFFRTMAGGWCRPPLFEYWLLEQPSVNQRLFCRSRVIGAAEGIESGKILCPCFIVEFLLSESKLDQTFIVKAIEVSGVVRRQDHLHT